jgi:nitrite reductase/ring-hydroxylating ferredoxin subunit
VSTPGREGLTGTAPANIYKPLADGETITVPPDGRPMEEQPAWRQDFPIDWPQDHYVARRDFAKFLVLTSIAFTVGQFWICFQSWWRRWIAPSQAKLIARMADLPIGAATTFTYPDKDDKCILIRTAQDQLLAYNQKCTHLSCAVVPQPDKGVIHCPCHQGYFDLESGRPVAGPPRRPLPRINLEVRGDEIYATGIEWRTV